MIRLHKTYPFVFAILLGLTLAATALLWRKQHARLHPEEPVSSAGDRRAQDLVRDLESAVAQGNWQQANALEGRLAAAGPAAIPALQGILAEQWSETSSRLVVGQRAAWVLGEIGGAEAVAVLTAALEFQKVPALRGQLALALSRIKGASTAQALPPLQKLLLSSGEDWGLRRSVALLLAKNRERMAAAFLVATVRERKAPEADLWIVEALGFSPHPQTAAPLLRELVRDERDASLRAAALRALALLEREGALDVLGPVLRSEPNVKARQGIVGAMKDWAPSPEVQALLLRALTEDENPGVRVLAAEALGRPGRMENLALLERAILNEKSIYVRLKTVEAMGRVGGKAAETHLEKIEASAQELPVRGRARAELRKIRGETDPAIYPHAVEDGTEVKPEEF